MKNNEIKSIDLTLVYQLKDALENSPKTHAMWLGGSIAAGFDDELSDADLFVDIDDGTEQEIFELVESFLEKNGKIDQKLGTRITPPYTHRTYHMKGMSPYDFIEVTLHVHSNTHDFNHASTKIKVLFDKDGTTDHEPRDELKYAEELEQIRQSLLVKLQIGETSVEKEIVRGNFMDAMHNYEFWLIEPVIKLARIKLVPDKAFNGLKHGNRDLPKETIDEVQSLYTIKSLEDIGNKIEEIRAMAKKYS